MKLIGKYLLIITLINSISYGQGKGNYSLPKNLNWKKIEQEFYTQLNTLRKEKGVIELKYNDPILNKAAFDQSKYMDSVRKLTHDQKIKGKESPQNRVLYYKGTHDLVGENCIMIYLFRAFKTKYSKEEIIVNTEKEIATALFLGWKNSPGHYKNMIAPNYDIGGLGYSFNKDSSKLYCAQVFSTLPYTPPVNLVSPANSYEIKEFNKNTCSCMNSSLANELDLMLVVGTDSVYLKSEKLDKLKAFFNEKGDGIYLDYVIKDQFICSNNNLLHGSPIYDGYMTKPVLFSDLFKKNKAPGSRNFFATIGAIPKELNKLKYDINYGVIKKGVACTYTYPIPVPEENLEVLYLIPKWIDNPDLTVKEDTFNGTLVFNVPFESGEVIINDSYKREILSRLEVYKPFIKNIRIKTFSSVEGNSNSNLQLQKLRAQNISNLISSILTYSVPSEIESTENWNDFFNQLKSTRFSYLCQYDKALIKKHLTRKSLRDSIDPILRKSRVASIEFDIIAKVNNSSHPYLLLGAYKKSLEIGDSLNAFACQSKLISYLRKYQITNSDLTRIEIPPKNSFIAHLTNWVGLATNDEEMFYSYETRQKAIFYQNIDTTYLPLQFNYCIMALKYMQLLGDTIVPINSLERKMNNCYKLKTSADSLYVDYMFLNYNIMSAYNHYINYRFDKINQHLQGIRGYFTRHELSESEALKLGLLFNLYGRTQWTLEILKPIIKNYPKNNDLLFLYLQTYTACGNGSLLQSEYEELLIKAKKRDPARFNEWVDIECFQLMRKEEIKKLLCNKD